MQLINGSAIKRTIKSRIFIWIIPRVYGVGQMILPMILVYESISNADDITDTEITSDTDSSIPSLHQETDLLGRVTATHSALS